MPEMGEGFTRFLVKVAGLRLGLLRERPSHMVSTLLRDGFPFFTISVKELGQMYYKMMHYLSGEGSLKPGARVLLDR